MSAIVEITDLWKTFRLGDNDVHALSGISLRVEAGEFMAIMGASGSGKSTLLNVLGCLDRPTAGHYVLGGEDVSTLDDDALSDIRGRRIGFIFQSYNLVGHLTVLENIEVPLYYQGWEDAASRQRARELAEVMGLGARLEHRPWQLSGGQQQRVAIARSLAADPLILLADEPTGNLDSTTGMEILKLLAELHQRGRTIIMVTHDTGVAHHAQRILSLGDGKIITDEASRKELARV